jgi:hypothetical protein
MQIPAAELNTRARSLAHKQIIPLSLWTKALNLVGCSTCNEQKRAPLPLCAATICIKSIISSKVAAGYGQEREGRPRPSSSVLIHLFRRQVRKSFLCPRRTHSQQTLCWSATPRREIISCDLNGHCRARVHY